MLVMWTASSSQSTTVQYGTSPSSLSSQVTGKAVTYSYQGYDSPYIFSATMKNLSPGGKAYYYRIGSDSQGWSKVYNFVSAPTPGTPNMRFGVIGDVGATEYSNETIEGLMNLRTSQGLDHILHAGDLSYANNYNPGGPVWDRYGEYIEPLAAYTPYNPSVGNHEVVDSFIGFRLRYGLMDLEAHSKGGDFYWSYNFGNVHVIMLSSQTEYAPGGPQYTWLEADLKAIDRSVTPWVVAVWHMPWYNSNEAHPHDGEKMQSSFEDLFHTYKVDLGLCGHVHAYERTTSVYKNKIQSGATSYLTLGNGGTPEGLASRWRAQPDWSVKRIAQWGHTYFNFVNSTHAHMRMFLDSKGTLADENWYVRN